MTRHALLALVGGAAFYALALPPFDCWPLAWIALVPLLLVSRSASDRTALATGALAGFLTAWTVTWWLVQAINSYFAANLVVGAAATCAAYVLAVSSTFGLFAFLAGVATRSLAPAVRPIAIAALWVACEFLRARVLADPWALLGYTQYRVLPLLQLAPWTGVYGVSFVVALGNAAVAEILASPAPIWNRVRATAWSWALVASTFVAGAWTLPAEQPASPRAVAVAVVQTNVPPAYEWTRSYAERQLRAALALTDQALTGSPQLVVWPENSLSLYLEQEPLLLASLRDLAQDRHADLVIGGPRHADGDTFNSAYLVRSADGGLRTYDKQRLVPFAEAPPFHSSAGGRHASPRIFTAGRAPGLLRGHELWGISICHETLYPEVVHPAVASGATVLINIANDGWLDGGYGVASRQHFGMAVFRAVEARRSLVRAATTGISGVIDPWGRIRALSPPDTATVLTASVEPRTGITPYVRHGDWFAILCLLYACALARVHLAPARARRRDFGVSAPTAS